MRDESSQDEPRGRRHGHRRERRRRHSHRDRDREPEREAAGESALPPEERAWRQARRNAELKLALTGDALRFGVIVVLLLVFIPIAGVVALFVWGPGLVRRFYRLVVEPGLRERFIEDEVDRQVHATLSGERRALEGEHARSMEALSASIAHEIRNPITAAKSLVQQMEEDPGARENVEYARVALEELARVERSVSHLLRFARDEEMVRAELRLAEIVDSALESFRDRLARSHVALERRLDGEGALVGDAEKLRRVVINLVGNALDALAEAQTPEPRIEVQMGANLAGSEVWLRVADNGPGIDPEALPKLFSPFYTSKQSGTGLGLAISKKLVEAHGGALEVESEPGRGAAFVVRLPRQPPANGATP